MSVYHPPCENFHKANTNNARDEDRSIHNLQLRFVGLKEFEGTIYGTGKKTIEEAVIDEAIADLEIRPIMDED